MVLNKNLIFISFRILVQGFPLAIRTIEIGLISMVSRTAVVVAGLLECLYSVTEIGF